MLSLRRFLTYLFLSNLLKRTLLRLLKTYLLIMLRLSKALRRLLIILIDNIRIRGSISLFLKKVFKI